MTLRVSQRTVRLAFWQLSAVHLGLGFWMALAPHSFFATIGAFGHYNRHYERDTATFYLALGFACAVAARHPGWRVPVLSVLTVQYALHTINHALDAGRAGNSWAGPVDVISIGLTAVTLAVLLAALVRPTSNAPAGIPSDR